MASIRERTSKAGETTYAVLYRHEGRQSSMTFASRKHAEDFRTLLGILGPDKALASLSDDNVRDALTLDELAEQYFAWKPTRGVTERTITDYRRDYDNWIKPWLGHRAADAIDEGDVQKWIDHMAGRLAPKSVADRHMILHSIYQFGRARSRQLVTHNPCLETDLPKRPSTKGAPKGTTVPEFRAILSAAEQRNPDAADLILFLGETGWRWSEAAALDVRDVEDNGTDVWVTVTRVFRIDGNYRQVLTEDAAKSQKAFRRIRMFPDTAAMLRRRVIGRGPGDLVFTNPRGRHWSQNVFLRETWPRILADAQLGDRKPTPHWLRHMHVAVLAAAGTPMHEIQRRIGHEHYSTTVDVYGGMVGDMSDEAVEKATALMRGERSAPSIAPVVAGELVQLLD
jgi:integrase